MLWEPADSSGSGSEAAPPAIGALSATPPSIWYNAVPVGVWPSTGSNTTCAAAATPYAYEAEAVAWNAGAALPTTTTVLADDDALAASPLYVTATVWLPTGSEPRPYGVAPALIWTSTGAPSSTLTE